MREDLVTENEGPHGWDRPDVWNAATRSATTLLGRFGSSSGTAGSGLRPSLDQLRLAHHRFEDVWRHGWAIDRFVLGQAEPLTARRADTLSDIWLGSMPSNSSPYQGRTALTLRHVTTGISTPCEVSLGTH